MFSKLRKSTFIYSIFGILLITGCANTPEPFTISHYIGTVQNQKPFEWRMNNGIPLNATIGLLPDGKYINFGVEQRLRIVARSPDPYENDIPCYLDMQGSYQGQSMVIQAPCKRQEFRNRNWF